MPLYLKILASPEGKRDGEKITIPEGNTVLGRSNPPAQLVFDGSKVSRRHCQLVVRDEVLRVDDLHSANGVFVNGQKTDTAMLRHRDRIVIGEFVVEVVVS